MPQNSASVCFWELSSNMIKIFSFKDLWQRPNGYSGILRISLPLVISMGSHTVMLFTDRLFLGHYSLDTLAAATPAGMLSFMFLSFFMGVISFSNTFVAQYVGAGLLRRVGAAVWQAIYCALGAGIILAALAPLGGVFFKLAGHGPGVRELEIVYFSILMQGAVFSLMHDALASFYSGRGRTRAIMLINLIGMAINIPLDWMLIFGRWGLPEMGIAGSAVATVASHALMLVLFMGFVFRARHEARYGVRSHWRFEWRLFARLWRFGTPAGLQFFMDTFAFAFFLLMVGRLGRNELAATNIAFALNSLGFMPMIGFSIAVSTLVGQAIGAGRPQEGAAATRSALHLAGAYMWVVAALYILLPGPLCDIFRAAGQDPVEFGAVRGLAVSLLRFVAIYSLLDVLAVIYSGALKGAGDTKFIGWTILILSVGVMVGPLYLAVVWWQAGLYVAWSFATLYICLLAVVFYWRYRQGRWQSMRVIERHPLPPQASVRLTSVPG